jgi:hypothetical protein
VSGGSMSLSGVLAALIALLAGPVSLAAAAAPLGAPSTLVRVGPGVTESSQRQVVRTRDGLVYIAAVDDEGYDAGPDAYLHMYRATTAGLPTEFNVADAAHEPHVSLPLDLSGGDARIDAGGTIHVTYVVANLGGDDVGEYRGSSLTVKYQTFDTGTEAWGPARTVTTLAFDGDGVRGRVVSALALDPSGSPLVITASSAGVSAWSPAPDGAWARSAVAGEDALHPSVVFDAGGRAHLAWLSSPIGTPSIRYASRAPDGSWSAPEVVADDDVLPNDTNDQSPSLAFDAAARPTVLWLSRSDDVRVAVGDGDGVWTRDDPPATFAHSPGLYLRGDDRLVFLGHDRDTHPAYLSYDADSADWSSVGVFAPPADEGDPYAYDGGASPRFDPLFDPDCRMVDVAFFSEYSQLPGRIGQPDLYYAAVTLPEPPGGCPPAPGMGDSGGSGADGGGATPDPGGPASDPGVPTVLLGDERIAPQLDTNPPGIAEAFESVAPATGTVDSISIYLDASSTGETLTAGLYADQDGHPGSLLAYGNATAKAGAWNAITLPAPTVTAGDHYWIALLGTGSGRIAFRDDPGGGCRSETTPSSMSLDSLPSAWSTGNEFGDCPVSAYGIGR